MDLAQFNAYTAWHEHVNDRRYDAPADPWRLVDVDPATVDEYNNELRLDVGLGRVQGGDWDADEHCHDVTETTIYTGLRQRFVDGMDWADTALYQRAADAFDEHESFRGYGSLDEFHEVRCPYLDDLYESIASDGYRPNAAADHDPATAENAFEDAYAHHLEPLVVVGRNGGIYLAEGFHRFVIARILGVDAIPVQVVCRHERWQATRDAALEAAADGRLSDIDAALDHPDLRDVVAES